MRIRLLVTVIILIGIMSLLGGIATVFSWGMYTRQWEGPLVTGLANMLPIPAGRVGDRVILYREYLNDVRSIRHFLASEEAKQQGASRELNLADRQSAFERLLIEAALDELAAQRNIVINDADLAALTQQAIDDFSASSGKQASDIEPYLRETYDWSLQDFQKHIVRPALLERMLTASYASDHSGDENALNQYIQSRLEQPDVIRHLQFPAPSQPASQ